MLPAPVPNRAFPALVEMWWSPLPDQRLLVSVTPNAQEPATGDGDSLSLADAVQGHLPDDVLLHAARALALVSVVDQSNWASALSQPDTAAELANAVLPTVVLCRGKLSGVLKLALDVPGASRHVSPVAAAGPVAVGASPPPSSSRVLGACVCGMPYRCRPRAWTRCVRLRWGLSCCRTCCVSWCAVCNKRTLWQCVS